MANRVSHIQDQLPTAQWRHVPGKENPADCASRGISPGALINHSLWWTGPVWLRRNPADWPSEGARAPKDDLPEQRATAHITATQEITEPELLFRFSSLHRLLGVTAWCLRWRRISTNVTNTKNSETTLRPDELDEALLHWLRVVQGNSIVRRVLDHYVLVSGGSVRVSDVTRGEGVWRHRAWRHVGRGIHLIR